MYSLSMFDVFQVDNILEGQFLFERVDIQVWVVHVGTYSQWNFRSKNEAIVPHYYL